MKETVEGKEEKQVMEGWHGVNRRSSRTILNEAKNSEIQMNSDVSKSECVSDSSDVLLLTTVKDIKCLQ